MAQKLLWRRKFFTLLGGQAVSLITSSILQMAIIFYLTERTGSAMVLSLAALVGFLPQALFGPMIGVLVDRMSRKAVMIGADLMVALAGGMLAVVALFIELPIWIIMVILFIRSIGTAFHGPAFNATTPLIVPEDRLTKCSGYSQMIQSIGFIISPAAAAFLYAIWDLKEIILLDIGGALVASATVAALAIPSPEPYSKAGRQHFMQEIREGYDAIRENKGLFALLWIGTLYMFVYSPISALYPLMSMQYFGGTAAHASAAEVAFAVGMLGGGILLSAWGGFKKRTITLCASILLMGISIAASGLLPSSTFPIFLVCCAFMGLSAPFYGVQTALFQEKIKAEYLGRVFSLFGSLASLAMPVGLLFSGLFAEQLGVHRWFFISGLAVIGIAVMAFRLPSIHQLN
ncbi:MFS transporter [Sporolactobacillus terrae]|uniref:MFS transporter n=1 Tax=Sporolactobacillus terrae TaxID=269673 RepID=A0ABX5Q9S1_9BACL|nr:MFS transporter [Sporolactobacillus terrae]QAA23418.1 MFS transporter [Sporolactobacillus terrae]QAA26388.1 MFS transporter [Sporolactobacillus terrae]UAK15482.1 MFS transporter [Sporolactobacillus terrae]